ncbi:PREDICTED: serpin-ZX-like [Erythranthe guttata]|uniref:serpin-ZX-like n=1 Tax=Erythranthe guttata TaxID=4155 RepID=UPI00064D9180|nr:PREDICTED: serpin-ZX-like [Erythranthe guttata]|eukprot:XP_012851512.1 PREDICTED: serpin-ZX-like [Erythranthe guttata]
MTSNCSADEVVKEVNTWAEKETNGLIKDLLSSGSVEATTILIFANALYFKGAWKDIFMEYLTSDGEFFLVNGSSIHVPFMTGTKMQYARAFDGFKVLRREYKQGGDYSRRFSMYFFLPDAKDGLPALLEKVCSEPGFIEAHKPDRLVLLGKFRVPKFKIDFQFEVSDVLKGLGVVLNTPLVVLPFCRGGLTEMVGSSIDGESLFVSGMFQKAFIEVNEKGTEAAAVSHVRGGGYYEVELDFVADHPFLFVIREDVSAVVLFIGQLLNPLA